MKKSSKIIKKGIIAFFISIILFVSNVYADTIVNPDTYKPPAISNAGKVGTIGNVIIGGIQLIGSMVSVIVLIIIGIKFIVGSAEEKAEYKQEMIHYIIGAVMLFSISNILGIISAIFS